MYTPEEYSGEVGGGPKTGWGHATFVAGCELAKAAGVKQLVLHHHDPSPDRRHGAREGAARARALPEHHRRARGLRSSSCSPR